LLEETSYKDKIQAFFRFLADFLTISRFIIAAFIVIIGIFLGYAAFRIAVIATLAGWMSDSVDGFFARNSGGRVSWVARVDFVADMALAYSFFLFMVVTKMFPIVPALILVSAGALIVLIHPTRLSVEIVSAPICALPIVLSFSAGWIIGTCYMVFLLVLVVVRWDRLTEDVKKAHSEAANFLAKGD
jgi:phosphatidylglycerophosphate synthase